MKKSGISLIALLAAMVAAAPALAAPVNSGTSVSTSVDLSYTSGGATISKPSIATHSFVVDRRIDAIVTSRNGGPVVADQGALAVAMTYEFESAINDAMGAIFYVTAGGSAGALSPGANGSTIRGEYYVTFSGNPTPKAGPETAYDPLAPQPLYVGGYGQKLYFHIYANIPTSVVNGQTYNFTLEATPKDVFAGGAPYTASATPSLGAVDNILVAPLVGGEVTRSASQSFVVAAPTLSIARQQKVYDDGLSGASCLTAADPMVNTLGAIPGACVYHKVDIVNGGSTANGIVLTEKLSNHVVFEAGSIVPGDFDSVVYNSGPHTITASKTTLPAGTASFNYRAVIKK